MDKKNIIHPADSSPIAHRLDFRTGAVFAKNAVFGTKIGQLAENIRHSEAIFFLLTGSCAGLTPAQENAWSADT